MTVNATAMQAPPTSPLHAAAAAAFDMSGPGGAPIILAPRLPLPVGVTAHPPPTAAAAPLPPPAAMPPPPPQPSLVSFGDLAPMTPLLVHYDPGAAGFIAASPHHQQTTTHTAVPLDQHVMSTIAYVR